MLLLNYKPVLSQPTGIGVYANAVLPAFDQFEHTLIPGGGSGSGKERLNRLAWSQLQLPRMARKWKADLIFTPAPEGYLGDQVVPQVLMVHDLRPLSHPGISFQTLYFKYWVPPLLKQCKHILTNSSFTASEISRNIGITEKKISVTPLGFDSDLFFPAQPIYRFHQRPYLLHVGQAYPHKNLNRLIKAFSQVSEEFSDYDLILAGKPHPTYTPLLLDYVKSIHLQDRVKFIDYVSSTQLPDLYRGAYALIYPSLWEGFGLPILEAMACGTPVVTSLGSGTEELCNGDSALLVNPKSTSHIASALSDLLRQPNLVYDLRNRGLRHCQNYSWKLTSLKTADVIGQLISTL